MDNSGKTNSSWENVSDQYSEKMGTVGAYYHETLIVPNVVKLLNLDSSSKLLDLACGQGVLERSIPSEVYYLGLDSSKTLISEAEKLNTSPKTHSFRVQDVLNDFSTGGVMYSHAACILALQNMPTTLNLFKNAASHLLPSSKFVVVINHPYFRIPRKSGWGQDPNNKLMYRRVDVYMTEQVIPIAANPSLKQKSDFTKHFHHPLYKIIESSNQSGFVVSKLFEWVSPKKSFGANAKQENRSRAEIPLFMTIVFEKR